MIATQFLKREHNAHKRLLVELRRIRPRAYRKRAELVERIGMELEIHAQIEEEIFYPAFRERSEEGEDEKLFYEAEEEHNLVHGILPALKKTDPGTELFSARAKVLKDLVEHHAEEEETELFPRVRELMDRSSLKELGARLQERRAELKRSRR